MTFRILTYLFIIGTTFSCNQDSKEQVNPLKEKLIGEWELVDGNIESLGFYKPFRLAFFNDSVDFFNGFYKKEVDSITGKRKYRYYGNFTKYRVKSDSIFIQNALDNSWNYWKATINFKKDTLLLTSYDSIKMKFVRLKYNLDSVPDFDQIIYSSSGCYGSCPILDFSLNKNGEFLFQGEGYTDTLGFYKGQLTQKQTEFIFNKFRKANILNIDKYYDIGQTDAPSKTTTFIVDGKIVKTIHDYGNAGPKELVWAYIPISNAYKEAKIDAIHGNRPFYPKLQYFTFHKDSLILSLEKSESFYLWTELKNSRIVDTVFTAEYKLNFRTNFTYWGPDPNENRKNKLKVKSIDTDGRFFIFKFENAKSVTYDLGYNFVKRSFDIKDFRKPKEFEIQEI